MHDCFEFVDESPAEDGEIGVVHFDHIECDVFCSWVGSVTEGDWERNFSEGLNPFSFETN